MVNLGICQESSHQPTQCQWFWDSSSGLQGPSSPHPPPQRLCSATSHDLCFSQILSSLQEISMKYGHFRHFSKSQKSQRRRLSFLTICFSHHDRSCVFICITFMSEPPVSALQPIVVPSKPVKDCLLLCLPRIVRFILKTKGRFNLAIYFL